VECGLITVKAFNCPYSVSSYRVAKLSDGFFKEKILMDNKQSEIIGSLSVQNTVLDGECCPSSNFNMILEEEIVLDSYFKLSIDLIFRFFCKMAELLKRNKNYSAPTVVVGIKVSKLVNEENDFVDRSKKILFTLLLYTH